jgi:tetratricopeptide (TPR) repeat protein
MSSCQNTAPASENALGDTDDSFLQSVQAWDMPTLINQAELSTEAEQYDEAAKYLELAHLKDSAQVMIWHLLADAYLDGAKSRKALEVMEAASVVFPDSLGTLLKLSEFQLILRRYQEALSTLEKIHRKFSSNGDAHLMKGLVLKELGDTAQAFLAFQYATREDPTLLDAWINAGQLAATQKGTEAEDYFRAGLMVAPNHIPLLKALASHQAFDNQPQAAIQTYRKIVKQDPDHAVAYFDLGLLYLDLDSIPKANDHFHLAIVTEPVFTKAYFYRGLTFELMNQSTKAYNDYQQALKLGYEDPELQSALNRIEPPRE